MASLPIALALAAAAAAPGSWQRTDTGLVVRPASGPEAEVRLAVYGDRIVRVTTLPAPDARPADSLMVTAQPAHGGFTVRAAPGHVILATPRVMAEVDLADGRVSFRDAAGRALLEESGPAGFAPVTIEGRPYVAIRQQWNRGTDEGLYGLGQHQEGQMNYNGEDVELAQHNIDVGVPFVVSTRNYGILWDNNSITRFGNPEPYALAGADDLHVTGEDGAPGWSAVYRLGARVAARRAEASIDYQYLDQPNHWPTEVGTSAAQGLRVSWTGRVSSDHPGLHRFRLYGSSYFRLWVDGRLVMDRWRQNWNPWYHGFDVPLAAGRSAEIRIEWVPDGGYLALEHSNPRPEADRHSIGFASEAGQAGDYYFIGGADMDGVIAGYRALTGRAELMPRWAYGFWQSRQRYETQDQLLGVLAEYRRRQLPLDNIVQDWRYWAENDWGSHVFEASRYPNPQAMVDQVHAQGAHIMISVWPKFYPQTGNFRELQSVGGLYMRNVEAGARDWVGPGYLSTFYDPYNPRAREIYWRQVRDRLASLGMDAWWLDASEPDMHSNLSIEERARRMGPTALGPGAAYFNSYPLMHAANLHDHLIQYRPDVRPFILTRSGFAGLQRTSSAVWSGDVPSRWESLREQISAGINFSMSGIPNWSHDIGGYTMEPRYASRDPAHVEEWRELNMRWFQFGAFSPIFRSHGETIPREIYEMAPEGSPTYAAMAAYDRLRYRLMPYIYTVAADAALRDGTIMRGLVMDFEGDRRAWGVDDEYLFGPALLAAPVTAFHARSRDVYLPAGTLWYDFRTGHAERGGRTIHADAPYEWMPLYVRAGAILPTGPAVQTTADRSDPTLTLHVFTGTDGAFTLYEDDGVSRQYLHGASARIPIAWNERARTLTIGARQGSYPGMAARRTIRVVWYDPAHPRGVAFDGPADRTLAYSGAAVTLRRR
jgi:alpha-D-xyloside xylohydrolase